MNGGLGTDTVDFLRSTDAVQIVIEDGNGFSVGSANYFGFENIVGSRYGDSLTGNNLDNELFGFDGDDSISGGGGDDILAGGLGKDHFIFGDGSGRDVIIDFNIFEDVLVFGNDPYIRMSDVLGLMTQHETYVLIDLGHGNAVRVNGVTMSDFTIHNFMIAEGHPDGPGPFIRPDDLSVDKVSGNETNEWLANSHIQTPNQFQQIELAALLTIESGYNWVDESHIHAASSWDADDGYVAL